MLHFNPESSRSGSDDGQFSAREMLRLMQDHIWEIVRITLAVIALALAYVFLATPIYSADVLVRVDATEPNALGISLKSQETLPPPPAADNAEVEVMQSRSVLEPIIQRYKFDVTATPRSFPILGAIAKKFAVPGELARPWLDLKSFAWGGEVLQIGSLAVPLALEEEPLKLISLGNESYELQGPSGERLLDGTVGKPATSDGISITVTRLVARPGTEFKVMRWNLLDAIGQLRRSMKIANVGKETGIVQLSYNDQDPSMAAEVANALAQQYIATAVASRQREDTKALEFINQELPRVRAELKQSEEALTSYQLTSQSFQPSAEAQSYLQGGIEIQKQIATLQIQRTQLTQRFTADSPWVRNVDTQLEQLNAAKEALNTRFGDMPSSERRGVDLARDKNVAETIYLGMVNRAQELSVRRASTTGGAHIVDDALRPHWPVKPKAVLIVSAAAGLGMFLGAFFVLMRRRVMTGVTDPLFVEHRLSVPVLGEVHFSQQQARLDQEIALALQRSPSQRRALTPSLGAVLNGSRSQANVAQLSDGGMRLLSDRFRHDPSVEALRSVRTALNRDLARAPNNIVMFTGPTPFAGKSFVASNLAALQAEIGSRVLLIDADMRRGHVASFFNQSNRGGLSDVLSGNAQPNDVIRRVGVHGLSFMACGAYPHNPAELLMTHRFKLLLNRLGEQFDLVIVDTPPFLAVTDAAIIAGEAGATVLVLRSGIQSEAEIAETVKKLERANARVSGAVFNAMPSRRSNRNYGYTEAYASRPELDETI